MSPDQLHEINWKKRQSICLKAYTSSKFYKEFYDAHHFDPRSLTDENDWQHVPVLQKKHLTESFDSILDPTCPRSRHIVTTTGGSTGAPTKSLRDRNFPEEVLKWRMLRRWNRSPAEDMLMLWRIPESHRSLRHKLVNTMIWWPTRRFKIDVSALSDDVLIDIVKSVIAERPGIIWGYVGAVETLARYMEREGVQLDYSPLVWVTAAPVSEVQSALFSQVFNGCVLDQYACSEMHWVASNIPGETNLTIEHDYRHVDILGADSRLLSPGQAGRLALTDLENRVFPLIKYDVGDQSLIVPERADRLSAYPRLAPVKGRVTDTIATPSGISLSGEFLTTIFDDCTGFVAQFQVHQLHDYSIDLLVAFRRSPSIDERHLLQQIVDNLVQLTRSEIPVRLQEVSSIESDRGKIRFVRSDVLQGKNATK